MKIDTDNNGEISKDEFLSVIENLGGGKKLNLEEKLKYESMFSFIDTNGDHKISYQEYFMWKEHNQKAKDTYKKIDKNIILF